MEKKSWKEQQLQQREEEIIQVARRMIAQRGFHDTNLSDVAKEVGIARGTIYLHFPTKEELLGAIIDHAENELLASMQRAVGNLKNPRQKLEAVLVEYLKIHQEYGDIITVLSSDLRSLVTSRLYGGNILLPLPAFIHDIIEAGKEEGLFTREINSHIAANALFSLVTMQTYQDVVGYGEVSHEELVASAVKLYFEGLGR